MVSKAANTPAAVKARAAKKPAADKVVRVAAVVVRAVAVKPDAETGSLQSRTTEVSRRNALTSFLFG